jgi:hypothetical protein
MLQILDSSRRPFFLYPSFTAEGYSVHQVFLQICDTAILKVNTYASVTPTGRDIDVIMNNEREISHIYHCRCLNGLIVQTLLLMMAIFAHTACRYNYILNNSWDRGNFPPPRPFIMVERNPQYDKLRRKVILACYQRLSVFRRLSLEANGLVWRLRFGSFRFRFS